MLSNCGAGGDSWEPLGQQGDQISQSQRKSTPEYLLEGLMLQLTLQYFGHLMWRANLLEKTLVLGKTEGRRRGWQRMKWLDGIIDSMNMSLSKLRERMKDRKGWPAAVHGVTESDMTQQLNKSNSIFNNNLTVSFPLNAFKSNNTFTCVAVI